MRRFSELAVLTHLVYRPSRLTAFQLSETKHHTYQSLKEQQLKMLGICCLTGNKYQELAFCVLQSKTNQVQVLAFNPSGRAAREKRQENLLKEFGPNVYWGELFRTGFARGSKMPFRAVYKEFKIVKWTSCKHTAVPGVKKEFRRETLRSEWDPQVWWDSSG